MIDQNQLLEWKKDLEDFVITDIKKAVAADILETSLIILCLIGTECVSGYFAGRKADDGTFIEFIKNYFPVSYAPYSELIYLSLRNGLLHDHVIKIIPAVSEKAPFELKRYAVEPHLKPCNAGQDYPIWFNRAVFADDFLAAWDKYFNELSQSKDLLEKLLLRIQERGYLKVKGIT